MKKLEPGCLAIVKGSYCNDGKIVQCVQRIEGGTVIHPGGADEKCPVWVVTPMLKAWDGTETPVAREHNLFPIDNPDDGEKDEFYLNIPDPRFEKDYAEAYGQ